MVRGAGLGKEKISRSNETFFRPTHTQKQRIWLSLSFIVKALSNGTF